MNFIKVTVVILFLFTAGCSATQMSNARKAEDISQLYYQNVSTNPPEFESLDITKYASEFAIRIPTWAAEQLLKNEAKKYNEKSDNYLLISLDRLKTVNDSFNFPSLDSGGVIIFLRAIKKKKDEWPRELKNAKDLNSDTLSKEILQILKDNKIIMPKDNSLKKYIQSFVDKGNVKLSFAGILLIRQTESKRSFVIDLLAYKYPILKAKNLSYKIPFTKFHKTDSSLTITLEGPDANRFFGKRFVSSHIFKVKWDRDNAKDAKDSKDAEWVKFENKHFRSQPIAVPLYKEITLKMSLHENCDFNEFLVKAGKQISEFE